MHRFGIAFLAALATAGAYAQGSDGGVTMSTDPARAAAVESHAQELKARQAKETTATPATAHKSTAKSKSTAHAKAHSSTHAKAHSNAHDAHKPAAKAAKTSKT
jgi:hypothetical protein